jgi:hypothetical protein
MIVLTLMILATSSALAGSTSATRAQAATELQHARHVVAFFKTHGWLRAPNQPNCRAVPWARSCRIARRVFKRELSNVVRLERQLYLHLPTPNDWSTAVRVAQRPFPGTERFLMSCSSAEGSHGSFVVYGGGPYYPGAEYDRTFHGWMVGGWMQYMWPTFKGHYRHALEELRRRGFRVELPPPSDVRAWLAPLGQALAAGWARWSGNDDSHWSASAGSC